MLLRHVVLSIRSSASREHVALQFTAMVVWLCVCVVSGVIAESLLFLLVTVNNGNRGGAAVFAVGALSSAWSIVYLQFTVHKNFKKGDVGRKTRKSNCRKLRSERTNHSVNATRS